jgi:hypothetical protein
VSPDEGLLALLGRELSEAEPMAGPAVKPQLYHRADAQEQLAK